MKLGDLDHHMKEAMQDKCPTCEGTGKMPTDTKCFVCLGSGQTSGSEVTEENLGNLKAGSGRPPKPTAVELLAYFEGKRDAYSVCEQEYKEEFGESRYKPKIEYMNRLVQVAREALETISNDEGSQND